MSEQLTFAEAAQRRDASMESVERNADERWIAAASIVILEMTPGTEFLGEDIRTLLDASGLTVHDRRALGPVVMRAARAGLIEKVGAREAKTSNLSLKPVWRRRTVVVPPTNEVREDIGHVKSFWADLGRLIESIENEPKE